MKKFTTLLLTLLLVIPAMASIKSGEILYLDAGGSSLWDQAGAKFSAYFWGDGINGVFSNSLGKKNNDTGYYEFTVPGTDQTFTKCIFIRNNNTTTTPGWSGEWNRKGDLTINGNLYTVTGWGDQDGTWSTYTPPTVDEPTLRIECPTIAYVGEPITITAKAENVPNGAVVMLHVQDPTENSTTEIAESYSYTPALEGNYLVRATLTLNNVNVIDPVSSTFTAYTKGVTYNVTVPENTPNCYIVGDMTDWSFLEMDKVNDTQYTITLDDATKADKYKYTCGTSWDYVEKDANGDEIGNRSWTETDIVSSWANIPSTEPADPTLYIVGTMNSWGHNTPMTWDTENEIFSWTGDLEADAEFLFTPEANWNNKYGSGETVNFGTYALQAGGDNIKWGGDACNVTITVNKDCNSMTITENIVFYEENILCETNYFLYPNEDWKKDGAWFAAYFQNKNTGAYTWVKGEMLATNYVLFYLSQYNVPENAAAPARAKAEDMPVYTHVTFHRMDAGATEMVATNSWNEAGPLTYDGEVYKITGWNHSGEWVNFDDIQTAIKDVEVANGITYAYGVVQAEGAIEVYNMNGAVVAHGNDNVDLRGLNGGVYIVRCGDNVRKVVR